MLLNVIALLTPLFARVFEHISRVFRGSPQSRMSHSYKEKDMRIAVSGELGMLLVQSLGLPHGLTVIHSQEAINANLTDRFYYAVRNQAGVR